MINSNAENKPSSDYKQTKSSKLCKWLYHNNRQVQVNHEECQQLQTAQQMTQTENTRLQLEVQSLKEKVKQLEIKIDKKKLLKEESDEIKNISSQSKTLNKNISKEQLQNVEEYQNLISKNKQLQDTIEQQQQKVLLLQGQQKHSCKKLVQQLLQRLSQQKIQIHNIIEKFLQSLLNIYKNHMDQCIFKLENKNKENDQAMKEISQLKIQLQNLKVDKNPDKWTETCNNQILSHNLELSFNEDCENFSAPHQVEQRIEFKDPNAQQIYTGLQDSNLIHQNQSQLQQIISEPLQSNNQDQRNKIGMEIQQLSSNSINQQMQVNQQLLNNSKCFENSADSVQTVQANLLCFYCNNQIMNPYIQTNCFHNYDLLCFNKIIHQAIIIKGQTQIFCLCNKILNAKILSQVGNSEEIQRIFFQNQLNQLKNQLTQKKPLQKCKNENCSFFYLGLERNNSNSICLYCEK